MVVEWLLIILPAAPAQLTLQPNYGNMLGGTPILVSGVGCLDNDENIECVFGDDNAVDGAVIKLASGVSSLVFCVTPRLRTEGIVLLQLRINDEIRGFATFYSCE